MNANITLTVTDGVLRGKTYVLEDSGSHIFGRACDCDIRLPNYGELQTVSRHHCLINVTPTTFWVRDLGSRNGTLLNGKQIGRPEYWALPDEPLIRMCAEYQLKEGDEIKLGSLALRVHISVPEEYDPEPACAAEVAGEPCGCA